MKISRAWLQTFFNDPLPESAVLSDALTFHAFEIESVVNDILDVKVTPNRGHDCLSHRGIAKELSAILGLPMKADPLRADASLAPVAGSVQVAIDEPALCKRYIAGAIKGVKVAPSPEWLKTALESIGQRSINNVVDATNYVMFHLGQPLHAFDAAQLTEKGGYAIRVRKARSGEKMLALDEREYEFADSMLLITDGHTDAAIGIAGVKGGKPAGITEATRDIIIESANFDGVSVRKTAQALKLRTDASARFEQVISAEMAAYGMKMVAQLIAELSGGTIEGFVDVYPVAEAKGSASATTEAINATLGASFSDADVAGVLAKLDIAHTQSGSRFDMHPPFERLDISIAEDIAEEVARIAGYEHIPSVELPPLPQSPEVSPSFYVMERIRTFFAERGFSEVYTSVFAEEGERLVLNKADGVRPFLRSSLIAGLGDALARNARNKDLLGLSQIQLFEIGTVWKADEETLSLGVAVEQVKRSKSASDCLRELCDFLGSRATVKEEPGEVLAVPLSALADGVAVPAAYEALPLSITERYRTFSRYPFIVRDVAFWASAGTAPEEALEVIRAAGGEMLARISLFDRFEKEGRVSYAFRLVFQSFDKTLTDGEANERMESVAAALKAKGWEVR